MTGRSAVVIGACGGCGTSLVAGAIGLHWARAGHAPWLIELDLERADLAGAWDLPADRSLADLRPVVDELETEHLHQAAFAHESGLLALPAPGEPSAADPWEAAELARLLEAAAGGWVAVDAGARPARAAALVERADAVLVVCPPTLAAARRGRRLAELLRRAAADRRAALVVNDCARAREIGARALGRAVGLEVIAELPWAEREAAHLGAGRWPGGRRRRLRAALERLAEAI